jgi:hypothetical protein
VGCPSLPDMDARLHKALERGKVSPLINLVLGNNDLYNGAFDNANYSRGPSTDISAIVAD